MTLHTSHDMRNIPDRVGYSKTLGTTAPARACFNCGIFETNGGGVKPCADIKKVLHMEWYQAGGKLDPFSSMRTNTAGCVVGSTPLGAQGTGPNGMPIRRDVPQEAASNSITAGPKEARPGLVPEEIDRKAYDEFMRGL